MQSTILKQKLPLAEHADLEQSCQDSLEDLRVGRVESLDDYVKALRVRLAGKSIAPR